MRAPATDLDLLGLALPPWSTPERVRSALERVRSASDHASGQRAQSDVLYAVGNDHAGSYYPVVLVVLPPLFTILRAEAGFPRHAAIEILTDLIASFGPEPGFERLAWDGEPDTSLRDLVRRLATEQRGELQRIAETDEIAGPGIRYLFEMLDDPEPHRDALC